MLMDTPLRIELLGRFCAQQGDRRLTCFRTRKTALLLARLALFPKRDHSREELADLLWPDADLEAARNNLKQSLSALRRLIEPPEVPPGSLLIATRAALRLNPAAFVTDVAEFTQAAADGLQARETPAGADRLRQAQALYVGELLPGFYDDWVLEEREILAVRLEEVQSALADLPNFPVISVFPAASGVLPTVQESVPAVLPPLRLPMQWTRFFGRDTELSEITRRLGDSQTRLLTLTGPGGSGKTRLSLEAARTAAGAYGNRVYFVSLADLSDPALFFGAVADALHLPRGSAQEPLAQVVAALSGPPVLLVLDNLEQFGAEAAGPVLTLLTRLPHTTILATSRHRLYVAGEQEISVAPLPVPAVTQARPFDSPEAVPAVTQARPFDSPEALRRFAGVQVFVDRAQAARPDFQITPRNAAAVAEICCRLEGLPLALELAAAWAQVLSPAQIRDRLEEKFLLLVSRTKGAPPRHAALRETIDWSCRLLPPPLAEFWRALSIFRGGFTAEAAADICGEPEALECLGQLRARSLVTLEETEAVMRFRLMETLREFGSETLSVQRRAALAGRHAAYFLALAEAAEAPLTGPDQADWLRRLAGEQDNLRFALASGPGHVPGLRLRLAGALWRFWAIRGPLAEGRRFLEAALQEAGETETPAAAKALNGLAVLVRRQGDLEAAEALQRQCLSAWRTLGDTRGIAAALNNLGTLLSLKEEFAEAEPLLGESLALWRALEQPLPVAQTLNNLGFLAQEQGKASQARQLCTESLALFRQHSSPQGKTLSLTILASAAVALREFDCALPLCREVLEIAWTLSDVQAAVTCLQLLAEIRFQCGCPADAACLLGSAARLRREIGSFQDRRAQAGVAALTQAIQTALPSADFSAAWAAGEAFTLEEAAASALSALPPAPCAL